MLSINRIGWAQKKSSQGDKALTGPLHGMTDRMDNMMVMILELSHKVHGQDKAVLDQANICIIHPPRPQVTRRRARSQDSPSQDLNLDLTVHQRVEQRLRQVTLVPDFTSDKDSLSREEQITQRKKKTFKSGIDCTGATLVKKCIKWLHECLFAADGNSVFYGDLTLVAICLRDTQWCSIVEWVQG